MARTFVRQYQSYKSDLYDDSLAAGSAMESASTDVETDLNALRSQIKRATGETKWYTALTGRDLKTTAIDLTDLENKKFLFRAQILTDVSVTAAQNWEVLSVAGSEAPSEVAAVGTGTANGAVVALATNGAHSLAEVAGVNALNPKNLVIVRDATTGDPILSGGKQVYGLIQGETGMLDGDAFDDTSKRAQISFVIENATADDLIACPVVDIAGKSINYSYVRRINLDNVPEQAFLTGAFVDQSGSVDVTLDNAIDNQSGPASQVQNIEVRIADTKSWAFEDSTGTDKILEVAAAAGGDSVNMKVANLTVVNANSIDFSNGLIVDSSGTDLDIGVTAGQIGSAGKLDLVSAAANDLSLLAGGEMIFSDTNKAGSSYSGNLKLAETQAEWTTFDTNFGEVSLLNAISQAYSKSKHDKAVAATTGAINADVNVSGTTAPTNLDATLLNYTGKTFVDDVDVYLNGVLLRNGADASANHDVYPGTDSDYGDLKFEFKLKNGDQITMVVW